MKYRTIAFKPTNQINDEILSLFQLARAVTNIEVDTEDKIGNVSLEILLEETEEMTTDVPTVENCTPTTPVQVMKRKKVKSRGHQKRKKFGQSS